MGDVVCRRRPSNKSQEHHRSTSKSIETKGLVGCVSLGRPRKFQSVCRGECLKNVPAEILVLHCCSKHLLDVCGVYSLFLWFEIWSFKTDLFQQLFHNRLETTRTDVFRLMVNLGSEICDRIDRIIR